MINLYTGTPGAGKTAAAMSEMLGLLPESRPLFVHGVPDLKIQHEPVFCHAKSCQPCQDALREMDNIEKQQVLFAEDWHLWAPDGAILFFDEVQHIYRPRASSVKPPESIMAFETHRHRGLDFYMVSQSPRLFDINLRQLIGRHIHIVSKWAGRYQFEWPECSDNVKSTAGAVKSSYKLDKKVFDLYKSASIHTKVKKKIPTALYALAGLFIFGSLLGYRVYASMKDSLDPLDVPLVDGVAGLASAPTATPDTFSSNTVISDPYDLAPLIPGRPETAPIYSHLVVASDFPVLRACVVKESTGDCTCYTQQMTVYETDIRTCHQFVKGRIFNPYKGLLEEKANSGFNKAL